MNNKNINSDFQIGKNYIKESKIDIINRKFPDKKGYDIEVQVVISDISVKDTYQYAFLQLILNLELKDEEKEYLKIYIKDIGEFRAPKEMKEEEFIELCKYNGSPVLSQNVRAYLKAITALSDIEPINLPMINFNELFNDENKDK